MRKPDDNFHSAPAPNGYYYDSVQDKLVADPLSDEFSELWNGTAHQNTVAFRKVFAPMPDDTAKSW
ncbi:phospholipase D/nuclease [Penicillium angulare]|uniref:phospholipase D/nuclease n=1 Tax=Penicillium angulare TaxID=116970 RepID=UPI00254175A1|nr:phospholipase D/nuclease [Penicillium angulare]KAJ5281000.1 phospholipase D/nuclease [Penicillium angulare]